jgi:FMN reductase
MSFPPNTGTDDEVVVLVGSPALGSRTSRVAQTVASALPPSQARVIELAEVGPCAEKNGDSLRAAQQAVQRAGLVVVATPVYKAGFTGVLKQFLDGLDLTAFDHTVAVPVVLSASGAHGALADLQLRIVLQATGALMPVPSFVLEEHHLDDLPQYVEAWRGRFGTAVRAVVDALRLEEVGVR